MARVTVEDCLKHVHNRFDMINVATKRARQLNAGRPPLVDESNNKSAVIALREIAEGKINYEILEQISANEHTEISKITEEEARKEMESQISI